MIKNRSLSGLLVCSLLVTSISWLLVGCDRQEKVVSKKSIISELDVWVHTGDKNALLLLQDQVARFNAIHSRIEITLISVPKGTYNAQIDAAIRTDTLPDIIELNSAYLANFAERGALIKLDKFLTETTRLDILPAAFKQGMYHGRLYSLATVSNSPVMYARKSALLAVGYRIPVVSEEAWNIEEFEGLLEQLVKKGDYSAAVDLSLNQKKESLTRMFHPILLSGGGVMLDEQPPYKNSAVLNSAQNRAVLGRIQRWINDGYVDGNVDGQAFLNARVALSWGGLEKYRRYKETFGDDLVVVPLPDFGAGSRRTQHVWGWGVTRTCEDTQAAMRFLEFLLQPDEVLLAAKANAVLPATFSALARFDFLNDKLSLSEVVEEQKNGTIFSQLKSPLYPVMSDAFHKALIRIKNGASVDVSLSSAVHMIDEGLNKFESERGNLEAEVTN